VFFLSHQNASAATVNLPDISSWIVFFDEGERDKIIKDFDDYLRSLVESAELNAFVLHQIQQDFMQIVHFYLKGKGIQAHQLFSDDLSVELFSLATHSVTDMKQWIVHTVDRALKYASEVEKSNSVIWRVKQFIGMNLGKDLSCEDIANQVFLNPIYQNRIFKKETGISLSEYIQQRRLKMARDLLSNTNMPVSTIAAHVGYTNFSHFSRMFRKHTSMSPMDFRKTIPKEIEKG
jgi:two-component system response regulator YesN